MKVLHLFSNYRLTGPSEPALNLCLTLQKRGWDVALACCKPPPWAVPDVAAIAERMGIRTLRGFHLEKHFRLLDNISDIRRMTKLLRDEAVDLLHVHMTNDHLVGGWAARRCGRAVHGVRTTYEAGLRGTLRNRLLMGRLTDALIVQSHTAARADADRFGLDPKRVFVVEGAVDTDRFSPDRRLPPMRSELGLAADDFVVGIVARIQLRRRFEDLLEALKLAAARAPRLKLMIVGRGTKMHEAAVEPAQRLGLTDRVVFAGYHRGDDYVRVLDAMDVKVFLVPGTDGSCRALREAMAMGKPAIAARRGMLDQIVQDGTTGLVVDGSPQQLADAMVRLALDAKACRAMGQAALHVARTRFTLKRQAERVEAVYRAVAGADPR